MAKHKILCPISHTVCTECAIYRGRHFYLCYSTAFIGSAFDPERIRQFKEAEKKKEPDKTFGMPETVEVGPQCINNFEEYAIEKEFATLKRELH